MVAFCRDSRIAVALTVTVTSRVQVSICATSSLLT